MPIPDAYRESVDAFTHLDARDESVHDLIGAVRDRLNAIMSKASYEPTDGLGSSFRFNNRKSKHEVNDQYPVRTLEAAEHLLKVDVLAEDVSKNIHEVMQEHRARMASTTNAASATSDTPQATPGAPAEAAPAADTSQAATVAADAPQEPQNKWIFLHTFFPKVKRSNPGEKINRLSNVKEKIWKGIKGSLNLPGKIRDWVMYLTDWMDFEHPNFILRKLWKK